MSRPVLGLITYRSPFLPGEQVIRCRSVDDFNEQVIMLRHLASVGAARDLRVYSCIEMSQAALDEIQGCVDITGGAT